METNKKEALIAEILADKAANPVGSTHCGGTHCDGGGHCTSTL